jgi:hypothetical protein
MLEKWNKDNSITNFEEDSGSNKRNEREVDELSRDKEHVDICSSNHLISSWNYEYLSKSHYFLFKMATHTRNTALIMKRVPLSVRWYIELMMKFHSTAYNVSVDI